MKNLYDKKHKGLNSGITLIALVLTIILLLILSGTSINLIIGKNGIVERAQTTGKIQTVASIKEALELEKGDLLVNSKTVNLNNYLDQISNGDKKYEISSKEIIDDKNAEIIVDDKYKFALKDTEEGDVEVTYQGVAASSDLSISAKSGTYVYPNSGTFTVTNNATRGELTVSSDATNIATATIEGNTVTVVPGTTAGKANIIVKSSANGDYAENKVVHVATVQNGTIELSVTPYTGIYDGKAHDAITKINVNPTDAKIEYSIDGENYSETVPTITETSSFTVTVRASKAGYKTQSTTETVKVNKAEGKLTLSATSGTLEYPDSTMFTVSGNIGTLSVSSSNTNVATASISGNTVTVKSGTTAGTAIITVTSAATTNYNAKSATYSANIKTTINDIKIGDYVNYMYDSAVNYNMDSSACGTSSNPTRGIPQAKNLKWQVLNVDKNNKTIDIIGSLTARNVSFYNMESYNNGVFILNDICEKQYSNNKLQVKARSVNLKDFEKQMTAQGFSTRNAYKYVIHYGNTIKESGYYPKLYKNQKGAGINTESVTQPSLTKDNPDPYDESSAIYNTTITNVCSMASALTITQTYYKMSINSNNYGDAAKVLSTSSYYWVAARCVNRGNWGQEFGLRYASSSELTGYSLSPSSTGISGSTYYYHSLRPVVTLNRDMLNGTKDSNGAWNVK